MTAEVDYVERARAMRAVLGERASEAEALRRIPVQTIADLHDSGLFRLFQA